MDRKTHNIDLVSYHFGLEQWVEQSVSRQHSVANSKHWITPFSLYGVIRLTEQQQPTENIPFPLQRYICVNIVTVPRIVLIIACMGICLLSKCYLVLIKDTGIDGLTQNNINSVILSTKYVQRYKCQNYFLNKHIFCCCFLSPLK